MADEKQCPVKKRTNTLALESFHCGCPFSPQCAEALFVSLQSIYKSESQGAVLDATDGPSVTAIGLVYDLGTGLVICGFGFLVKYLFAVNFCLSTQKWAKLSVKENPPISSMQLPMKPRTRA